MMIIDGIEIVKSNLLMPLPTIKLKDSVDVSDTFRASFNQWLLDMFGTKEQVIMVNGKAHISAQAYEQMRQAFMEDTFQQKGNV